MDRDLHSTSPRDLKRYSIVAIEDALAMAVANLIQCEGDRITAKVENMDFRPDDLGAVALIQGPVRMTIVFEQTIDTSFLDGLEEHWHKAPSEPGEIG